MFMCSGCAIMMSAMSPTEKPHIIKKEYCNEYKLDALYDSSFRKQINNNIILNISQIWIKIHFSFERRNASVPRINFCIKW